MHVNPSKAAHGLTSFGFLLPLLLSLSALDLLVFLFPGSASPPCSSEPSGSGPLVLGARAVWSSISSAGRFFAFASLAAFTAAFARSLASCSFNLELTSGWSVCKLY